MNNELYKIAAEECAKSYKINESIGATQWRFSLRTVGNRITQWLSIPGTNELEDMVSNLVLLSEDGIKLGAYLAAYTIRENLRIDKNLKLYITGHSLGGATAIAYTRLFGAEQCIVFAPSRCLRYFRWFKVFSRKMKNTTMFIDPDDPVSSILGIINFGLSICKTIKLPKNHLFYWPWDHPMDKFTKFIEENF